MKNLSPFLFSTLFIISIFFSFTHAIFNDTCNKIVSKSVEARLSKYFKCDLSERSRNFRADRKNLTEISIFMRAESLNFDDASSNLEFIGDFFVMWFDLNLTWNSSLYNDVKTLTIYSNYIWTPDIAVLSAGNDNTDEHGLGHSLCKIESNGQVFCLNLIKRKIRCETNFKLWPYDRQKCTLIITSWAYSSEQINFHNRQKMIYMNILRSNGEWNYSMSGVSYGERKFHYYEDMSSSQIAVDFVLDRLHTHLIGRYIAPAIIMMVLTLTTLWLDPKSIERLAIACSNIIIHMMCIKNLHWVLPHNGTTVPNLLIFYINSFIFATTALLLTIFLGRLSDAKVPVPKCFASSTALLFRNKTGRYFQMDILGPNATAEIVTDANDTGELLNSEPYKITWTSVVIVWGWISFFCFFFAYIIMYAVLIPSSAGKISIPALNVYDRVDGQFGFEE